MLNQGQIKKLYYPTLTALKAATNGRTDSISYCLETDTMYAYLVAGSAYTANDKNIVTTGDAGDTRYLGIFGKYGMSAVQDRGYNMPLYEYYAQNTRTIFSGTGWANNAWRTYAGVYSVDTVNFLLGTSSHKVTTADVGGGVHLTEGEDLEAFNNASVSATTDFLTIAVFITAANYALMDTNGVRLWLANNAYATGDDASYHLWAKSEITADKWTFLNVAKSALKTVGSPDLSSVVGAAFGLTGTPGASLTFSFHILPMVRKDSALAIPNQFQTGGVVDLNINSGTWFVGYETTAEYSDKLVCRNLDAVSAINALVGVIPYSDFIATSRVLVLDANYAYSIHWQIDVANFISGYINSNNLSLQSYIGGIQDQLIESALVVADNSIVEFTLIKKGTSVMLIGKVGDGTPVMISATVNLTGIGYLGHRSPGSKYANLESLSVTTIDHSDTCNTAETTNRVNTSAVAESTTNGNILINEKEVNVYTSPDSVQGGFYIYDKAVSLTIVAKDIYHAIYDVAGTDMTEGETAGWTYNKGRLVDANITSEADNTVLRIVTSGNHLLTTDDIVNITGANNAAHNGATKVTVINDTTFDCQDINYAGDAGDSSAAIVEPAYLQADAGTSGVHHISWALSASSAVASKVFKFEPVHNITHLDNAVAEDTFPNTTVRSVFGHGNVDVVAGDKVWGQVEGLTDGTDLVIKHFNMTAIRNGKG